MPATVEALLVVVLSIVPGFLALAAWSRGRAFQHPTTDARLVIRSVALSFAVQTFLAPVTLVVIYRHRDHPDQHPFQVVAWTFVATVAAPILGGYVAGLAMGRLSRKTAIHPSSLFRRVGDDLRPRPPTAFDWLVDVKGLPDPSLLVVTFRDGTRVCGLHVTGSWYSVSPEHQGVYLPRGDGAGRCRRTDRCRRRRLLGPADPSPRRRPLHPHHRT